MNIVSGEGMFLRSLGMFKVYSVGIMDLTSEGVMMRTALQIHDNGPSVQMNTITEGLAAKTTIRAPEHEPWGRISTNPNLDVDSTTPLTLPNLSTELTYPTLELDYDDPNVNRIDRGITFTRGKEWKR